MQTWLCKSLIISVFFMIRFCDTENVTLSILLHRQILELMTSIRMGLLQT
nr:MAG TPA: hypothetical protein [Caudoviricetes sp.]